MNVVYKKPDGKTYVKRFKSKAEKEAFFASNPTYVIVR